MLLCFLLLFLFFVFFLRGSPYVDKYPYGLHWFWFGSFQCRGCLRFKNSASDWFWLRGGYVVVHGFLAAKGCKLFLP